MARRWYVPFVTILIVAVYSTQLIRDSGIYSTRTVVYFAYIQPNMVSIGPYNGTENEGLIAFAGAVASEINNGRPVARYAWDDAPLYGAGMREGVLVGLADTGGQWLSSYNRAEIEIQIVGRSYEWVRDTQQSLLQTAFDESQALQGAQYYDPKLRVSAEVSPLTTTIDHITASTIEKVAAVSAAALTALLVGGWGAILVDRRSLRRARSRNKAVVRGLEIR